MVFEVDTLLISFCLTEDGARGKGSGNSFTAASSGAISISSSSASIDKGSGLVIWFGTLDNARIFFEDRPFTSSWGERSPAGEGDVVLERRSDENAPDRMKDPRRLCISVDGDRAVDRESTFDSSTRVPDLLPAALSAGEPALLEDLICRMRESLLRLEGLEEVASSIIEKSVDGERTSTDVSSRLCKRVSTFKDCSE